MSKENKVRKVVVMSAIICALVLVGILGSYAFFISSGTNNPENISINTGTLALIFADGNPGITQALEFGGSVEKTFTIENTGTLETTARIMWEDFVNTYLEGSLTYTLSYAEEENGTYIDIISNYSLPLSSEPIKTLLAGNLVIPADSTLYYKLIITLNYLSDVDQTADLNAIFSTHFKLEESEGKDRLLDAEIVLKKMKKTVKDDSPILANSAVIDETADGLYSIEDNYGMSYYFRGAVEDNYVKFGTWKEGENVGKSMYWRIIRINGDGSIRMQYDGTVSHANGGSNTDRISLTNNYWNFPKRYDAKYVGYMFGGISGEESTKRISLGSTGYEDSENAIYNETDSNVKTILEEWYKINLTDVDKKVADAIYCNDRSIPGKTITGWASDTGLGYGNNPTGYGAYGRNFYKSNVRNSPTAQLVCGNRNDSFTKHDDVNGNAKLKEKVGIITADEILLGGSGKANTENRDYFLYKGFDYWTMSPMTSASPVDMFILSSEGALINNLHEDKKGSIVPVISLTPEYFVSLVGNGTMTNPYREPGMEP